MVMSPGLACFTELVPGVLRAGGRGGERGVGELEVLTGQRVIVQPQQTGDQLRPAWPRLRVWAASWMTLSLASAGLHSVAQQQADGAQQLSSRDTVIGGL